MYYSVVGSRVRVAGSMHMLPADAPHLPQWLWDAYAWSEDLLVESDPPEILQFLQLTDGTTLAQHVPAKHWTALQKIATRSGIPAEQFTVWKPWAALLAMEAALQPYAPGVETQFLGSAQSQGKPTYMLETGASIAALLDRVPPEIIVGYMTRVLDAPDLACKRIRQLHQGWIERSPAAMYEVARETPVFQNAALKQAVLTRRNLAWMPRLRLALQSPRNTLVVVGALHLCGTDSIWALLKQEGYTLVEETAA